MNQTTKSIIGVLTNWRVLITLNVLFNVFVYLTIISVATRSEQLIKISDILGYTTGSILSVLCIGTVIKLYNDF